LQAGIAVDGQLLAGEQRGALGQAVLLFDEDLAAGVVQVAGTLLVELGALQNT
jgi:hypothetical protein